MHILPSARRQDGAALMIFALILVLGTSWMLVSSLNKASEDRNTSTRIQSGATLKQAKDGLIGYVITQAALSSSVNPGRFPCPEAPASAGGAAEGTAASSCTLPAIGRLPWKTLGMDKLTDGSGDPLWYVLSTGWGWNGSVSPKINTDTTGNLALDGTANSAIALIIAPGAAMTISPNSNQTAAGCAARTQRRDAKFLSGPPDYRDYLECENASSPADSNFVTSVIDNATNAAFNDQVIAVSAADIMSALDGVVTKRITTEVIPTLATAYSTVDWSGTASKRWFPYAAAFGDNSAQGVANNRGGILPMSYSGCTVSGSDPRCNPTFVSWKTGTGMSYSAPLPITNASPVSSISIPTASAYITVTQVANSDTTRGTLASLNCSASTSTQISCTVGYGRTCNGYPSTPCGSRTGQPTVRLTVRALNVAKVFRTFDTSGLAIATFQNRTTATSYGASPLGLLRSDGDADITTEWLLPSKACTSPETPATCLAGYTITIPIGLLGDHAIINSNDSTSGWFVGNDWHRVTYFGLSSGYAPGGAGSCSGATCVTITGGSPAGALLVFGGRDLLTPAPNPARRPSSTLSQYLEGANTTPDDTYETQAISSTFNDRVIRIYP